MHFPLHRFPLYWIPLTGARGSPSLRADVNQYLSRKQRIHSDGSVTLADDVVYQSISSVAVSAPPVLLHFPIASSHAQCNRSGSPCRARRRPSRDIHERDVDFIIQELEKSGELDVHFDRRQLPAGKRLWDNIEKDITGPDWPSFAAMPTP
jgi:hypothetical protein